MKIKFIILITIVTQSFFVPLFAAKNSVVLLPKSGSTIANASCSVTVISELDLDSISFSLEYRSEKGSLHSKRLGTISTAPYSMTIPLSSYKNQYFFGANLIAFLYRQDDTVQIVNSPRLFFMPEKISTRYRTWYPEQDTQSITQRNDSIWVTYESNGVIIHFDIPFSGSIDEKSLEPVTIVLDPRLSRTPFPGSNTIIVSVPFSGESQLVTSAEHTDSSMFSISRTGTPIQLKKAIQIVNHRYSGTVTIPDFLLGGTIPDTLGINVIIPHPDGKSSPISLVEGDMHHQYTPILFPLFVKSKLPNVVTEFPKMPFSIALMVGILVSILFVSIRKTSKFSIESISKQGSNVIECIELNIGNSDLSSEFLASRLNTSPRLIKKEIKKLTGKSLTAYIEMARIEIAKEELALSNASEIWITTNCGFKNLAAMEDSFHRLVGMSPYNYRKSHS